MLCMMKNNYHGAPITKPTSGGQIIRSPGHNRASRSFANTTSTHAPLERLSVYLRGKSFGTTWCNPRTHLTYDLPLDYDYVQDLQASNIKQLPLTSLQHGCQATGTTPAENEIASATESGRHLQASFVWLGWLCTWDLSRAGPDAKGILARFVSCLASSSPVCSYLPLPAASALSSAIQGGHDYLNPHEEECMGKHAPLVHKALVVLKEVRGVRPFSLQAPEWKALFLRLCDISIMCVTVLSRSGPSGSTTLLQDLPEPDELLESQPSCKGRECLNSGIICGLQRVRGRVPCDMDNNSGREARCRDANVSGDKQQCNHGFHAAGKKKAVFSHGFASMVFAMGHTSFPLPREGMKPIPS